MRQGKAGSKKKAKQNKGKRKNRLAKKAKLLLSFILVAMALLSFVFASINGNDPKTLLTKPGATPSPTASATSTTLDKRLDSDTKKAEKVNPYTTVDSMAIIGGFALARQTPTNPYSLKKFIGKLASSKNKENPVLDLGVKGNILVDYILSPSGFDSDVCYAVKAPTVEGQSPTQDVWVTYYSAKSKTATSFIMIAYKVTSCQSAKLASQSIKTLKEREKVSQTSHDIVEYALTNTPSIFYSPLGLALLDESRGFSSKK